MDNDLNRSIRLLENALSSTNKGLLKKSFIQRHLGADENISRTSIPAVDTDLRNVINKHFSFNENVVSSLIQADQTVTGNVLQASQTPWKTTFDSLYTEFFEILSTHAGGYDILDIVTELARCCSDALKIIQSLKSKVAVSQLEEEISLEKERNTWRLIFILYQDRLLTQNLMKDDCEPIQYFGQSEKLCVQNLFKRNNLIRESQLIIDWLECSAADRDDETLVFSDSTVGWENTLHQLKSADTIAFSSTRQIVTQLDPDAPNYQKKSLHDLDAEDEKRLIEKIFMEIRCGKLEEAQKLCRQCGHAWKAALYEGWRLFHDPNNKEDYEPDVNMDNQDDEMDSNEMKDIEGNCNRDIWKNMAIKFCKQDYLSLYERAAIATFCGYLSSILTVCNTWEDCLWAHMKTMVDIRVESEIRDCVQRNNDYLSLPDEYWNQRMSLNEIFSNLESSKNARVREESRKPEHIIQKYIILDEIPTLLLKFEEWIEEQHNIPTNFLRFLAHLVLFFDQIGQGHHREIIEKVLEAYIKRLMVLNETQLVAFYVSKLNPTNQVLLYSKYLEKIIAQEDRKDALMFAEDSGLDVHAITKQVVENIRNIPHATEEDGNLQHKITEVDKYKISSLDWILYDEYQRAEAIVQTNALIFTFLTLGKLDAAQLAFNKVPPNSVEKIIAEGVVNDKVNQTIKEYLCYKAYLDAQEAFSEWFKHCKSQPMPPDSLPENVPFPEKVAHQHRESQYKAELGRWKLTFAHYVKNAKAKLYNVILFPDGWIVGAEEEDFLRSTCIPEIVLLLYAVLYESGQHEECLQLADIIASEKYGIYKVYSKEKLGEILVKLCESSVALLNAKKDPWGNETSA
ncbi:nuclear pore complex protein Nup107 [Diorhabda sublineata]|uniref:nuclear pore complex protein Nup107 n=1 Tax=Diorhabda sublineata TaxID=1163346 RepID=UPI0024E088A2|nr:nuclear pore complex protein Nup107 [Diorhabda sublineata]